MNKTCGTLLEEQDELISDKLQWVTSHGRSSVWKPARTYLQQFCTDTRSSLEVLPEVTDGEREREREREKERERELRKSVRPTRHNDDDIYNL